MMSQVALTSAASRLADATFDAMDSLRWQGLVSEAEHRAAQVAMLDARFAFKAAWHASRGETMPRRAVELHAALTSR